MFRAEFLGLLEEAKSEPCANDVFLRYRPLGSSEEKTWHAPSTNKKYRTLLKDSLALSKMTKGPYAVWTPEKARADGDYPTLAPFSDIRWTTSPPTVVVYEKEYELVRIFGKPLDEMLKLAASRFPGENAQRRLATDLPQILLDSGYAIGATIHLSLREPGTGKAIESPRTLFTEDNHRQLLANLRK